MVPLGPHVLNDLNGLNTEQVQGENVKAFYV